MIWRRKWKMKSVIEAIFGRDDRIQEINKGTLSRVHKKEEKSKKKMNRVKRINENTK